VSAGVAVELSPELIQLGLALGLLRLDQPSDPDSWTLDSGFFADPGAALGGVLSDPVQRQAAMTLAATLLGRASDQLDLPRPPAGQTWLPIAQASDGDGSGGLFVVLDVDGDRVDVGLAGRAALGDGDGAGIAGSVWVPIVRVDPAAGASLLLGAEDGVLRLGAGIVLPEPGAGDEVALGGAAFALRVPTRPGGVPSLGISVQGLRLPGWPAPRDLDLGDDLSEIGATLVDLLVGLVQASAGLDAQAPGKLSTLLTLAGLGDTSVLPPLPVAAVAERGPAAAGEWATSIVTSDTRLREWLRQLGVLLGITIPNPVKGGGTAADPYRVCFTPAGGVEVCLRVAVERQAGVPTALLGVSATAASAPGSLPAGAAVPGALRADADLARVTFGALPQVQWIPRVTVAAQLGSQSDPLVQDPPDLAIGWLRAGFEAGADHRVGLLLEAREVTLAGSSFPVLDLTSVDAVTQAAGTAGGNALNTALTDLFGTAGLRRGQALAALLGLVRPVTVPASDTTWPALPAVTEVFADPLGAVAR
jgi:large repetitive protein